MARHTMLQLAELHSRLVWYNIRYDIDRGDRFKFALLLSITGANHRAGRALEHERTRLIKHGRSTRRTLRCLNTILPRASHSIVQLRFDVSPKGWLRPNCRAGRMSAILRSSRRFPYLEISSSIVQARGVEYVRRPPAHAVAMSKTRFTEAEIRRAVRGVLASGAEIASIEIWPDGRIFVKVKEENHETRSKTDPEDDPEVSRRLL
jgi:hypothetical protein